MFRRETPASNSGWARRPSCEPLVVMHSSRKPGRAAMRPHRSTMPRAYQWLAAGQADLAGAQGDETLGQLEQFFQGQDLLARQELHVLGHAIDATEVAAVGHRHAQVVDFPVEAVHIRATAVLFHVRARMGWDHNSKL